MTAHLRTLATLAVLALLLVVGGLWGWNALSSPFPHKADAKKCVTIQLGKGDRLRAGQVTVSVYNASDRVGLADLTMSAFEDQGFGAGDVGNAPKKAVVPFAQVWTRHPQDPAVQLVASRLGPQAHVVKRKLKGAGVVVVVGNSFQKLVPGQSSVKITKPTVVCGPPA